MGSSFPTQTALGRKSPGPQHSRRPCPGQSRAAPLAWLLVAVGLLQVFAACARNPVSGRPEAVLTSERAEIEQGNRAALIVEGEMGLVDDPALEAYLEQLGQRLAIHSPRSHLSYRFKIADIPEANAFALPGGYIYVSRGLLALANSEDQLAAVLGHEIAHVAARHSVQRQTVAAPLAPLRIAAALGGAAAAIVSPGLGEVVAGIGQFPAEFAMAAYSRDQEREADRLGQQLAAEAGFDPMALSTFNDTLIREEALKGENTGPRSSFLLSHPPGPERSAAAQLHAAELVIAPDLPAPLDRKAFLGHLEGLVIGQPALAGVFQGDRFLHPQLGIAFALPGGWQTFNNPSSVLARSPDGVAEIVVEIVGEGDSALLAAQALGRLIRLDGPPRAIEIGELEAAEASAHVRSLTQSRQLLVTFIAYNGLIYRIAGTVPVSELANVRPEFTRTTLSFHPLGEAEREEIFENHLRLVRAEDNENLAAFSERSENQWSKAQTAVANGIDEDAALPVGEWFKIARREPYRDPGNREGEDAENPPTP